ncbi:MAG: PP2C family protein-serine/threonine phosphatase [Phycisphaerales bacterium]
MIESTAFRKAALKSESGRATALLVVLGLTLIAVVPGNLLNHEGDRTTLVGASGVLFLMVLQAMTIVYTRRLEREQRSMPLGYAVITVIAESVVPSAIILIQVLAHSLRPHAALMTPPLLAYGLLLMLTTLRLRPALCLLAGGVSAASYGTVALFVFLGPGRTDGQPNLPVFAYGVVPAMLVMNGLAAAWVCRQVRSYVESAVHEAETQARMDRINRDLEAASAIQHALLPRQAPSIRGYDVAGWNRPADQTGGDYYDWQRLPDGRWLVSLADVSGHGIGPAFVTAACRAYLRASSQFHVDLPSLIGRVNALLAEDLPEGRFVTLASLLLTPDGAASVPSEAGLLSAGHGPMLLWVHASGKVDDINPGDLPLAVLPDTSYGPAQTVRLEPGDVLALITDGFFEWSSPQGTQGRREQYGLDRLRASLRAHAHKPASEIVTALADDATRFAAGEPQQDDLTVVIVKKLP